MVKNARTLTRKLGRTWSHRLAMFRCAPKRDMQMPHLTAQSRRYRCRNMATSLIEHERIKTTLPKAKELRRVMDRLVTKGKAGECRYLLRPVSSVLTNWSALSDTQHKRKQIASYVREDSAVDKLFTVLGPRYLYVAASRTAQKPEQIIFRFVGLGQVATRGYCELDGAQATMHPWQSLSSLIDQEN